MPLSPTEFEKVIIRLLFWIVKFSASFVNVAWYYKDYHSDAFSMLLFQLLKNGVLLIHSPLNTLDTAFAQEHNYIQLLISPV